MMNAYLASAALLCFLAVVYGVVNLWDKRVSSANKDPAAPKAAEGDFRYFYHLLWVLLFWILLVFLVPLAVSYREELRAAQGDERWFVVAKMAFLPFMMLLVWAMGLRRGYMRMLNELSWPGREE